MVNYRDSVSIEVELYVCGDGEVVYVQRYVERAVRVSREVEVCVCVCVCREMQSGVCIEKGRLKSVWIDAQWCVYGEFEGERCMDGERQSGVSIETCRVKCISRDVEYRMEGGMQSKVCIQAGRVECVSKDVEWCVHGEMFNEVSKHYIA